MFRFIIFMATILGMAAISYAPAPANAATFCAQHVGAHPS
jgi:hypothetical protein